MASGTINGSTGNQYIDAKIEWASTPDTEKNQSYVTARLYYKRNNVGYTTQGTGTFSITINGNKTTATKYVTITEDGWVKVAEAAEMVSHASDGTKSITISASGRIPDTSLTSTSVSGTATLNTIPRASVISSVGSSIYIGASCSIKWTPHSTAFRYKIHFQLDDWSYITEAIHPNTTNAYTYKGYKYPYEIAEQFPNSREGVMTATLYTYSDSSCKNQLGVPSSKEYGIMIVDNLSDELIPTVVMNLSPVTSLGSPFNTMYIQGKTKVRADFTGSEGKYGATISKYTMTVGGKDNGSYTSGYLSQAGEVTVSGWAKDSRGLSSKTIKKAITVIPYQKPQILPASGENAIICARCDKDGNLSDSGTYLKIKARRSYSKVISDGVQNNFCSIRFRYRTESDTSFSTWKTILAKTTSNSDTADTELEEIVTSTTTAYVVQVGVVDDIGNTAAVQFMIPTDSVTIDIPEKYKGKRIGLLRYAQDTEEEGIDVGAPIHGGGVDNLTLGEKITATSAAPINLNNIKTPGNYYSPSATNSEYIQNSPYTTGGFSLIVREIQSVNMIRQELFYGRTNWQRHYNSSDGTWSEWLRYLMTEYPETTAADFVTETGVWNIDNSDTNKGYWRYRKWKSGAIDMNGLIKVEPVSEGQLGTAGVYYSQVIYIDLPFEVVNFQFTGSSTSYHIFVGNTNSVDGDNKQIRLRLYRFTDFPDINEYSVYIRIVASGKLK